MRKKIIIALILLFVCNEKINGLTYRGCDSSTISRLKSFVSNINLSYEYRIDNNITYFNVTVSNIPNGTYFIDTKTSKTYYYSDTNNGELIIRDYTGESGSYKFYSNVGECKGILLGVKYYKFPIYNIYYKHKLCSDVPNFRLCQKWVDKIYPLYQFENQIQEYKSNLNKDDINEGTIVYEKNLFSKIVEFYVKYYYLILGVIIIACWLIIIINKRKNSFKL